MSKLKDCPFCGATPRAPYKSYSGDERTGYNFVVTISCHCGVSIKKDSHQDANGWCNDTGQAEYHVVNAWNTRVIKEKAPDL